MITAVSTGDVTCDGYQGYYIRTPVASGITVCGNSPIPSGYVITRTSTGDVTCDGYDGYFIVLA